MTPISQLEKTLQTQYNLKCFIDLAELTTSPTRAYQHFDRCYQEVFDHNDRLVFYTSEIVSDQLLQHLYKATDLIDVSNYFVLICSPHQIKQPVNKDPFQTLQIFLEATNSFQENFVVSNTLCPLPWRHVEVLSSGEVRPCCVYTDSVDHVKNNSLNHAFNNTKFQTLRQDLLSGKRPSGCNKCWENEKNGLTSNRHYHMRLLKKELLTKDLDNPAIKSLDLKPGNTCNFKCRICNPVSS